MTDTEASKAHILMIEDDVSLAEVIQDFLRQQGYQVSLYHQGQGAVDKVIEIQPDLVILDWMLPGVEGLDICRDVKSRCLQRVLMLTAKDDVTDQIIGLEMGADDYMVKPVQPRLLLARIRALLRRPVASDANIASDVLRFGQLVIQPSNRRVMWHEQLISLTTNEFELLLLLARHAGQILHRDDILAALRGIGYDGLDRSVDLRISRLRRKLGDDSAQPKRIQTVWGKGYLFAPDAWDETIS